ncbi:MAG: Alpha-xylosidase [bacterium ADurb.Bin429]|nr:MAG: Alpha-xylosidase [bacterium ADurb.Bin429]
MRIYRFYAWLRMNLLDYFYAAAVEAHETGVPMMRALPLAFPGDATVADCDDEYLLGPDLLVAPVHTGTLSRTVRFPAGRWTDFWTGEVITGPCQREADAPLDRIPLYLRAGALLLVHLNGALRWGASMTGNRIGTVVATSPADGEFKLNLDDALDRRYLLIYGTTVSAVMVNGRDLPRLRDAEIAACPPGWYEDGCRTIVRLPAGRARAVAIAGAVSRG